VAIKIPLESVPSDIRQLLFSEARLTAAVDHPSVVRVHDAFSLNDGTPIMVMELLEGETLGALLEREGKLPLPEAARIFVPLISAVHAAHALGIIHRDLKPDNVLVANAKGHRQVKLLDFGIAKKLFDEESTSATGNECMVGTPRYMSPEQMFGERDLDQRVDVWAMGAMLYEVLTGQWPVEGDMERVTRRLLVDALPAVESVAPELPRDVHSLIGQMLVRNRAHRLAGLREALCVLRSHCERLDRTGRVARARPAVGRNPRPPRLGAHAMRAGEAATK
jgi:serine/threonine-protein kinase